MHPILSQIRKLGLYLLVWIPIAGMLVYLLGIPGGISWRESVALALPLCLLYAFICLTAWYPCRVTPLDKSSAARIVGTHMIGALVAASLWVVLARVLALMLSNASIFPGLDKRFSPDVPLVGGMGDLLYLLSVAFYYVVIAVESSRAAEARANRANLLARDAELRALKAQVNPHFLFNSLNSISALTSSDPARAREMCILLGDFLRRTLGLGEKAVIPLEEELSLVNAFLAVEKIRFGARLRMEENVEKEALAFDVPPLLLQPLVENAVAHGVANLVEGGCISLGVQCTDGVVRIEIENSFDPDAPPRRKGGVGLANVRQRLTARFGSRASFEVNPEGDIFRVAITLPAEKEAHPA
ncbi:MAG TPA: histidine kinase [Candidatus Acidoferrum sp.]|nr:histidine kinase [Candidatus Acidoferrum sp.]